MERFPEILEIFPEIAHFHGNSGNQFHGNLMRRFLRTGVNSWTNFGNGSRMEPKNVSPLWEVLEARRKLVAQEKIKIVSILLYQPHNCVHVSS